MADETYPIPKSFIQSMNELADELDRVRNRRDALEREVDTLRTEVQNLRIQSYETQERARRYLEITKIVGGDF